MYKKEMISVQATNKLKFTNKTETNMPGMRKAHSI